jgi:hypothetical protein
VDDEDTRLLASTFNTLTSPRGFQREATRKSACHRSVGSRRCEIRNPLMIIGPPSTLRSGRATAVERRTVADIDEEQPLNAS